MKTLLTIAGAVGFALLAGCAPAPMTRADVDGKVICHAEQMDQVERAAKRFNHKIVWVNCPQAVLRAA